jgi:hypothetical protein
MKWNAERYIRMFFLLLYALYAFTPVSLYAMADSDGLRGNAQSGRHATSYIVWVNGLFSFFADDELPSPIVHIADNAQPGGDAVLVKKRRAVCREQFNVKPLLNMKLVPSDGVGRASAYSSEFDIAKNPLLQKAGNSFVLITDPSPPFLLS